MPKLYKIGRYNIFFWSDEIDEPIHVHIAIGRPSENTTKVWLTRNGGCILAKNSSKIPPKDLFQLMKVIQTEHSALCSKWKKFFDTDNIKFYC